MLTYFLQVNVCWLLFYGVYYALLSRETFFKLNRIYLIISLLCGLVIPVLVPKMDMPIVQPLVEVVQPITVSVAQMQELLTVQTIETQPTTLGIWTILMKLYSLGVAFFLLKFCWGLVTIFKLYRNGKKVKNSDFSFIYTEGVKTPFSFFNWIFVNQNTVENADFQHIITHEQAHVRQKHSFDILGLEILRGAFWLSPLVHLYARSLRNVHEYLADAAVLQNTQKQSYGRLLINQTVAGSGLVLANHLNFSQLKKRIIMMSRNPSQRVALVKYTFAAPIFLLIVALLASPKTKVLATTAEISEKLVTTVEEKLNMDKPETVAENTLSETLNANLQSDSTRKPPFNVIKNPIPYPMVRLANKGSGVISLDEFRNQKSLTLSSLNYERPVVCVIQSFVIVKYPKGSIKGARQSNNTTINFSEESLNLIQSAQDGDTYKFLHIKGRCQGDSVARNLGDLAFIVSDNPNAYLDNKVSDDDKPYLCLPIDSRVPFTGGRVEIMLFKINTGLIIKNNINRLYSIVQYSVYKVSKTGNTSKEVLNKGAGINGETAALIQSTQIGDNIYFKDVLVHKLGESEAQNWGTLQFTMAEDRDWATIKKLANEKGTLEDIRKTFDSKSDCAMKAGDTGQMPAFQGGEGEVEKFIYSNLRYPEEAKKAGREGLLAINYVINSDGQVSDVKSWNYKWANPKLGISGQGMTKIEAADKPLIDEAIRVVGSMPRWKPGTRNGVVSCHSKIILIKFQIEK